MSSNKCLVVLSGGQDSTTCAFWARKYFHELHCVTFNYGQRHHREIEAARIIARQVGAASHEVVDLGPILKGRSPLTDPNAELEQYSSFDQMDAVIGNRVELTFVPMRNALFLSLAANRAICLDINTIVTGVCQEDNANYPDCRGEFILAQEHTINQALGLLENDPRRIHISTPLLKLPKKDTVNMAWALGIEAYAALAFSHTAYDGKYPPTGQDHATILRAHGFEQAGLPDPLILRAHNAELLNELPATDNYKDPELNDLIIWHITKIMETL